MRARGSAATRWQRALCCCLSLSAGAALAEPATPPPSPAAVPPCISITRQELMQTVEFLAAPRLQGRLAGSPGYHLAAQAMAQRFRDLGLRPGGEDGYFQKLLVEYNEIQSASLALALPGQAARTLQLGEEFTCRGLTGSGDVHAPLVFAGYGMSRPASGYDDYAGLDVRGKIVLAFKEAPPFQPDSTGWGPQTLPRPKGRVAAAHGAVALLLVSVPSHTRTPQPIGSMLEGDGPQDERFPRLQLAIPVAADILRASGFDIASLQASIDSLHAPQSRPLGGTAHVVVKAHHHPQQESVNVVGILPGSDPHCAGQYVVVGAHLDHVGSQGAHVYFPGANDNASGSACVLGIAAALAGLEARPARSVVFALFSSEEAGLLGARRFVERPPVARDSIVAFVNLDCVGHGDSIEVGGGKTRPQLWQIARELDASGAHLMVTSTWPGGGADAAPFEENKIPNLYFASKFSYRHLHLTSDTPATLNPRLLEAVARLACQTTWRLAQGAYAGE
jgi:aminopeptidase YwaD